MRKIKLGVNIDHVATVRQARGGKFPDPAAFALEAEAGGADSITAHLREDRRHIQDRDIPAIQKVSGLPLNLEMAVHPGIVSVALTRGPEKVCLVPEKRQELTTEGGLDLFPARRRLAALMPLFERKKINVSFFIDPDPRQIRLAAALGARAVEIHTGTYAEASPARRKKELRRIREGAKLAKGLGLEVHAGHGLDYQNVKPLLEISEIEEFNIGFSIISRALFVGLRQAVREMKQLLK